MYKEGGLTMKSEQGFSLLSILVAVMIIGILAAIAVPKFNSAMVSANTARVKADLSTLDSAIVMYKLEHGDDPAKIGDLDAYVTDINHLTPPKGNVYVKGADGTQTVALNETSYGIEKGTDETRAVVGTYKNGDLGK